MANLIKFINAKIKAAQQNQPPLETASTHRIPPGQHLVKNFPVLDLMNHPHIPQQKWSLEITGLVKNPVTISWNDLMQMPQTTLQCDIHCVTRWSKLDMQWKGVKTSELLDQIKPFNKAQFVLIHSYDNYTTNLPIQALIHPQSLLAYQVDKKYLNIEHGGPVRLLIPQLYFWKSAKWLKKIEFLAKDQPGFWETRGYHNHGDPWKEERYGNNKKS